MDSDSIDAKTSAARQYILPLYQAFDAFFVLTSNAVAGCTHDEAVSRLKRSGLQLVAENLHPSAWATPADSDSDLAEEVSAWHSTCPDRTPTSYLIIAALGRGVSLDHTLIEYAALYDSAFSESDYLKACEVLHCQLSFAPFDRDWY